MADGRRIRHRGPARQSAFRSLASSPPAGGYAASLRVAREAAGNAPVGTPPEPVARYIRKQRYGPEIERPRHGVSAEAAECIRGKDPAVANPVTQISQAAPQLLVRTRRSGRVLLAGTDYRIGRDPSADIVVADPRVSWRHAMLRAHGATWVLEDSGSTNGTFLGPERTSSLLITTSFVVRLGNADNGPLLRVEPQPGAPGPRLVPVREPETLQAPAPRPGRPGTPALPASRFMPSVDRRPSTRMPLLVQAMRIGRTPDNDLVIDDLGVSRRHAELSKSRSGRYQIIDLGSHNGTFVNGARVDQAELADDDIVAIGHATFRLAGGRAA